MQKAVCPYCLKNLNSIGSCTKCGYSKIGGRPKTEDERKLAADNAQVLGCIYNIAVLFVVGVGVVFFIILLLLFGAF